MAIGDVLKGLFIQDVGEVKPQVSETKTPPPLPTATTPVKEDPKILEALNAALKEKALAEFDYVKFMEGQAALQAAIPDEAVRYKAAFATVRGTGITKARLIETAKHYLAVLDVEKQNFVAGVDSQVKDKIGTAQTKMEELDALTIKLDEQLAEIGNAMSKAQNERHTLAGQVAEWTAKIDNTKANFESASSKLRGQIEEGMQKITSYLE